MVSGFKSPKLASRRQVQYASGLVRTAARHGLFDDLTSTEATHLINIFKDRVLEFEEEERAMASATESYYYQTQEEYFSERDLFD